MSGFWGHRERVGGQLGGMLPSSPCAATPPCSPEVTGRGEEECAALEYAVLSGDRRQLAGRYADGSGVVLDAPSASYTHASPRGEVVVHRVPFACNKHMPQLRVMLDLYNSLVDRPLLCVRSASCVPFLQAVARGLSRLSRVLAAFAGVAATVPGSI